MNNRDSDTAGRAALSLLLFAVSTVGSATAAHSAGVALVTDLQGKAAMTEDGRSRQLTILAELAAGAQVRLDAGAVMVALYLDAGDEYTFKGPAQIVFRSAQPEMVNGAGPEKRGYSAGGSGKGIRIKPAGMAQGAIVMRSFRSSARIRLLNLNGTRSVETQPEFRWQELQPGLKYQFEIADATGRTLHEAQLDATSFRLPANIRLEEGAPYTWEISARLPDGRKYSSSGDFSIASAELRAQADARRPAASAPLSTRVAYAAWLDQTELKDEARKYWRSLAAERPDDARLRALAAE